jgi:hypothetical protein
VAGAVPVTLFLKFNRANALSMFQTERAAAAGYASLADAGQRLMERLNVFFADHDPAPSLLHGDLWGGNDAAVGGQPVLYDPALYYTGHDGIVRRFRSGFLPGLRCHLAP